MQYHISRQVNHKVNLFIIRAIIIKSQMDVRGIKMKIMYIPQGCYATLAPTEESMDIHGFYTNGLTACYPFCAKAYSKENGHYLYFAHLNPSALSPPADNDSSTDTFLSSFKNWLDDLPQEATITLYVSKVSNPLIPSASAAAAAAGAVALPVESIQAKKGVFETLPEIYKSALDDEALQEEIAHRQIECECIAGIEQCILYVDVDTAKFTCENEQIAFIRSNCDVEDTDRVLFLKRFNTLREADEERKPDRSLIAVWENGQPRSLDPKIKQYVDSLDVKDQIEKNAELVNEGTQAYCGKIAESINRDRLVRSSSFKIDAEEVGKLLPQLKSNQLEHSRSVMEKFKKASSHTQDIEAKKSSNASNANLNRGPDSDCCPDSKCVMQ